MNVSGGFPLRRRRGDTPPIAPVTQSRSSASRLITLPPTPQRWHLAVVELEGTLAAWSLPLDLARRLLVRARALIESDSALELYVELDLVDNLVSVELWDQHGLCQFGIDLLSAADLHPQAPAADDLAGARSAAS